MTGTADAQVNSDRIAAMEWAADYVERQKIFEVPLKRNGYPLDGYQAATVQERAKIIIQIAHWVMTGEGVLPSG